jgi:hypothetical protein
MPILQASCQPGRIFILNNSEGLFKKELRFDFGAGNFGSFDPKYWGKLPKNWIIFHVRSICWIKIKGSPPKAYGARKKE